MEFIADLDFWLAFGLCAALSGLLLELIKEKDND
jgi:hypothetical protein